MSYFEDTVAAFRAEIGMPPRPIDPDEPAVFRFEAGDRLFIERRDDNVLLYLEDATPAPNERLLMAALVACDVRRRHPLPVRACVAGNDKLVLAVAFADNEFTLPSLHQALDLMRSLQGQIMQ